MSQLQIHTYGDPILRVTDAPVGKVTERHRQLVADMARIMYESRGIGLASNQVGETERLVIVDVEWPETEPPEPIDQRRPLALINPEIIEESVEDDVYSEGCLSLPGIEGDVWRSVRIRYRYTDLAGRLHEEEATGLLARCIQHEIDHLNGILFVDRLAPDKRQKLAGKLAKLRQAQPGAA